MTITEFLLARIDEDEAAAREWYGCGTVLDRRDDFWLADCEAKRRIVEECDGWDPALDGRGRLAALILGALASVYADHADFDPAWRTEG